MTAWYVGWLFWTERPRTGRALFGAAAILGGHLVYLVILAYAGKLLGALPAEVRPEVTSINRMGVWAWSNSARALVPWNLPILAGLIQTIVVVTMVRWSPLAAGRRRHSSRS